MEVNENSLGSVYFLPEQTAALPFVLHYQLPLTNFPLTLSPQKLLRPFVDTLRVSKS